MRARRRDRNMPSQGREDHTLTRDQQLKLIQTLRSLTGAGADDIYVDDFGQTHMDFGRLRATAYSIQGETPDTTQVVLTLASRSDDPESSQVLTVRYHGNRSLTYDIECMIIGHLTKIGCYYPEPDLHATAG